MENLVFPQALAFYVENLRKIFQNKRDALATISLSNLTLAFLQYFKEDLEAVNELSLEFLMRLSYALYLKSKLLLDQATEPISEELDEEMPSKETARTFSYYPLLLSRPKLGEELFLPRLQGFSEEVEDRERGDLNLLLSAFLFLLERQKKVTPMVIEWQEKDIEEYIEELREWLRERGIFTFEEWLYFKGLLDIRDIVYYFLSLLFLVYMGECGLYQDEKGHIQIFVKN